MFILALFYSRTSKRQVWGDLMCCCFMLIFMFNFLHISTLLSLNLRFNLPFCRIQVEVLLMAILDKKHILRVKWKQRRGVGHKSGLGPT